MTTLPFTLRQLEIFEVLSTTRSFRLAAEQFAISQAAVSNHVKALERQLGAALFIRRAGKPPELSLEGLAFARDLRPFLETAQKLAKHRRAAIQTTGSRPLKIYVGLHLLEKYVRPKLDQFHIAHPNIELDFNAGIPGPENLGLVLGDKFDVALFHAMPGVPLDEHCRVLAQCPAGIFAHRRLLPVADHRLSIKEVGELPYVMVPPESREEPNLFSHLAKVGIDRPRIIRRAHYYDVLAKLVERGVGASYICASFIEDGKRQEVELVLPSDPWRLAIRHKPTLSDPEALEIEDLLVSCVLDDKRYPAM